jgi:hypothetical protein
VRGEKEGQDDEGSEGELLENLMRTRGSTFERVNGLLCERNVDVGEGVVIYPLNRR